MPDWMPKVSLRTLTTGARQLVVQLAFEMMLCFAGIVLVVVDAEDDGEVLVGGGGGDDHLFYGRRLAAGAGTEMDLGLFGVGEEAGGFDDDFGADGGPIEVGRVTLGEDLNGFAVDGDGVGARGDLVFEVAEDGVELEQVGEGGGRGQIVDRDDFEIRVAEGGAKDVATDASEAVDAYLYRHLPVLSSLNDVSAPRSGRRAAQPLEAIRGAGGGQSGTGRTAGGAFCTNFAAVPGCDTTLGMREWLRERFMRRRSRRAPNESESTGKIGQELPADQPAPLRPSYPEAVTQVQNPEEQAEQASAETPKTPRGPAERLRAGE